MTHTCHWPGCQTAVPPAMWGCRSHWFALPKRLRDAIWATYVPGQEIRKDPSREYIAAAHKVQDWIRGQGAADPVSPASYTGPRWGARCGSCGSAIVWASTTSGRLMPVDATPTPDGSLAVHRQPSGDLFARVLGVDEVPDRHEHRGTSHFATCPNAAEHRRPRRKVSR